MKPSYLIRGQPGHPLHPPLTDATIGIYTFATAAALMSVLGIAEDSAAKAWWLALIVGLIASAPTAATGLVDWLDIERGTPLWRTATAHMASMLTTTIIFAIAAITGHDDYGDAAVSTASFLLTLAGFATLTLGGWLGGSVVYVHGMRVLGLVDEPARRAVSPDPKPETEAAEGR